MQLSPPPLWQAWLFENPWPLVVALLAAAVVLRVVSTRRETPWRGRLGWAALGAVLLAGGVYLSTAIVETDRERLIDRTRQLVAATAPIDAGALDGLIARGAVVAGPDGSPWVVYDDIRDELEAAVQRHGGFDHAIRGLAAEAVNKARGRSLLSLSTTTGDLGVPIRTRWLITWRREGDGRWRVMEIRWLEFRGRPPTRGLGIGG